MEGVFWILVLLALIAAKPTRTNSAGVWRGPPPPPYGRYYTKKPP